VWTLPGAYFTIWATGNIFVKWMALVGLSNLYHTSFTILHLGRVKSIDVQITKKTDDEATDLEELEL
jgi:hypothetical protein